MQPRAIETRYKGYRFRSRLEARWAVFFDALGLTWEYEPEGFELKSGRYLPDFKVLYPGRDESEEHWEWFECKGDLRAVTHNDWERMIEFSSQKSMTVLDGTPDLRMYITPGACVSTDPYAEETVMPKPYKVQPHALDRERFGSALWCPKGRMWVDGHQNFFDNGSYFGCGGGVLENAVEAARGARLEHGESGVARG